MANKSNVVWILVLLVLGFLFGIFIGLIIADIIPTEKSDNISSEVTENILLEKEIVEKCRNTTLHHSAYCINREILKFYKYNISNIGKELTHEKLIEEGGVCSHYTKLITSIMESLNFEVEEQRHLWNETTGHIFNIVYGDKEYCVMDGELVVCTRSGRK